MHYHAPSQRTTTDLERRCSSFPRYPRDRVASFLSSGRSCVRSARRKSSTLHLVHSPLQASLQIHPPSIVKAITQVPAYALLTISCRPEIRTRIGRSALRLIPIRTTQDKESRREPAYVQHTCSHSTRIPEPVFGLSLRNTTPGIDSKAISGVA